MNAERTAELLRRIKNLGSLDELQVVLRELKSTLPDFSLFEPLPASVSLEDAQNALRVLIAINEKFGVLLDAMGEG